MRPCLSYVAHMTWTVEHAQLEPGGSPMAERTVSRDPSRNDHPRLPMGDAPAPGRFLGLPIPATAGMNRPRPSRHKTS